MTLLRFRPLAGMTDGVPARQPTQEGSLGGFAVGGKMGPSADVPYGPDGQ